MCLQSSSNPKEYANEKDILQICFYNQDESKCPSNISKKYYFSPKNYFADLFSTSHQSFDIFIAESIKLDKPLFFSSPVSYFLYGQHISGSIQLGSQTKLYLQDSHNLIITINWSVNTKKISKIYAKSQVQSIYILVSDDEQIDQISSYNLHFYSGEETKCILSTIESNTKNNYSIFNRKGHNYVQFTSSNHYLNYDYNNKKAQQNMKIGDNVYYTAINQNHENVIIINGTGPTYNFTKTPFDLPRRVIIEEGVTSIGSYLLSSIITLKYLEIPSSVTFIGDYAISKSAIIQLIIPNSVTYIGDHAIRSNYYLEEIEMSNQISFIGYQCFGSCERLNSITLYGGITNLNNTFTYCINLKTVNLDNCKNLQIIDSTFYECHNLVSIQLPETVSSISSYAFYYCYNLPKINLPNKITIISYNSFKYCCSLTSITIPENVKTISEYAFYGCYNFETITIPKNVESIGSCAFTKCLKLKEFIVNESNKYYSSIDGALSNNEKSVIISFPPAKVIESYEIPSIVIALSPYCFYYCTNIKHLTIHAEISRIPQYAFAHCHKLESLVLLRPSYYYIDYYSLLFCYNLLYIVYCGMEGVLYSYLGLEYNKLTVYVPRDYDEEFFCGLDVNKTDDILCRTIHYKCNQCNIEDKTCKKCDEGWKLNNNKCVPDCSLITDHCIECNSIGVCSSCEKGYILDENQQCIQTNICDNIIDNCAVCHKSSEKYVCDHCFDDFILSSDGLKCIRNAHLLQFKESFPIQIIEDIPRIISNSITLFILDKLYIAELTTKNINIIQTHETGDELILMIPPIKDRKIDSYEINNNYSNTLLLNCIHGSTISLSNNEIPALKGSGEIEIIRPANINKIILDYDTSIEKLYSFLKLKSNLILNISEVQVRNKQKLIGEKNSFCDKILIHPFSELSLQRMIVDSIEIGFSSSLNILYNENVITHIQIFYSLYNFDKIPIKFFHPFPNLSKTDLKLDMSIYIELEYVVDFHETFIAAKFISENEDENQNACKSLNVIKDTLYSYKCIKDEFGPNYNLVVSFTMGKKEIQKKLIVGKIASYAIGGTISLAVLVLAIYY